MPQPVSMIVCFAALLAVVMVSRLFGRAAGIFAAATCGASVAYVMPPAFSFEVDSFLDQIVLAAYGAISLLVLYRIPARFTRYVASAPTRTQPGVELSALVHRMLPTGIEVSVGDLTIEAPAREAEAALHDVLKAALAQPNIESLSVYGGRGPGVDRIWIAARYRYLPADPCVLISARRGVTSFDNGFEHVYQISLTR